LTKYGTSSLQAWEKHPIRVLKNKTSLIQAALLLQNCALLSGADSYLSDAGQMQNRAVKCAASIKLHETQHRTKHLGLSKAFDCYSSWQSWLSTEEKIRTVLALYYQDAELATVYHRPPLLDHGPSKVSQAAPDHVFTAPFSGYGSTSSNFTHMSNGSSWSLCTELTSIIASITEARLQKKLSLQRVERFENALQVLYHELLRVIANDCDDLLALRVLWHSAFLPLYTSFSVIRKCLSQDMSKLDEADRDYITEWATSSAGQRCVLHAVAIKQFIEDMPASNVQPLHVPRTVLFAAVSLICFIRYGSFDVKRLEESVPGEPLLQHLGQVRTSPNLLLADLDPCAKTGRPAPIKVNAALHGLIEVLERNGHWKVCDIFAAGLREVVEREPEQKLPQEIFRTAPRLLRANHNSKQGELHKHSIPTRSVTDLVSTEADAVPSHEHDDRHVNLRACRHC